MVVISEISSSSSSSTLVHRYDVFLSFRGFDTRSNFTDHLYNTLLNAHITTFLDDEEFETGLSLKPELEAAIKASRSSIIVLSQNYASSTWCLDELVLILEQLRNPNYFLIPIFYHVEPTDVRKQQKSFGEAMAKHKQRMETEANAEKRSQLDQKLELWKKALTQVADLKGAYIANDRRETILIEEIVSKIHRRLGGPAGVNQPHPIGMGHHIEYITIWLKDGSSHTADILTISGMSGIGKTTLAKYVYRLNFREFQRSSFIEGISGNCAKKYNGLLDFQKQIFGDISKTRSIQVHDVSVYTSLIENALSRRRVFLVLDDVDTLDQLNSLLGNKGFHPGSKVIITTKDASLTERCELFNPIVQPKHTKQLLGSLDEYESLKLLSFCAFKSNIPKEGYEGVSIKLVEYCKGHPLALEVLGKSLHNRDVTEWEDCIEVTKKEIGSPINNILRMSFDSLEYENDKDLFKHIACFFIGEDRNFTETILKACGILTLHGISNLIKRGLLMIGQRNELLMHQLVQEIGRDVVRQESLDKPWKGSRLWCHEESFKVLKEKKGTRKVKGLVLDMRMLEKGKLYGMEMDALSKMDNLMLLQLNYVHQFRGSYKNFPQELRWLCMHGFPLEYMPLDLKLENLVALDMSFSKLKSFYMSYSKPLRPSGKRQKSTSSRDRWLFGSLKILNLSCCEQLRSVNGFSKFPALERLILSNCKSLIEVCESIEQCDALDLIDLSFCNEVGFGKLLGTIGKVKTLKTLKLDGCNIGEFPIKTRDPEMLMANNIGMKSQTSPSAIVEVISRGFEFYRTLPLSSLVRLSLEDNNLSNESFPMDMSSLFNLKELCLDGNDIVSMPICVRTLPRLEILSIGYCRSLKTIEHPPRTLQHLIFSFDDEFGKVVFDQDMSPIKLTGTKGSGSFIEGMFKEEDMGDVEKELLQILRWTDLDFTNKHLVERKSKVQMIYEFGIFSTRYEGIEMPKWISERSKGPSISFFVPSSPYNLTGLNFCFVYTAPKWHILVQVKIRMSNITKNCTWIYTCDVEFEPTREAGVTYLSHWMFGKNEIEDGDLVAITLLNIHHDISIRECGVSFVYDEDEDDKGKKKMEEEDVLSYYKSWNHIIGGDLSPFQTTTPGHYFLNKSHFLGYYHGSEYLDDHPLFRAFPESK